MHGEEREETTVYKVVVSDDGRYSIWPADRENLRGWNDAGKSGTRAACVTFIEEAKTGKRPSSPGEGGETHQRGGGNGQ